MANDTTALTPVEVEGVHGYVDSEGTIWLKLEDAARGLEFTRIAPSGNEVVRWDRVRRYLEEVGACPETGHDFRSEEGEKLSDAFIPENVFYKLVWKSRSEKARAFQDKVTDVILPAIRKHGFYADSTAPRTQMGILRCAVDDIGDTAKQLQEVFGVKKGIALAKATDIVEGVYKISLNTLKELIPPADHPVGMLNVTQLSKLLTNVSNQAMNKLLVKLGLQEKTDGGYVLTELGRQFGEMMPFDRNGHSGYQIRWNPRVIDMVKQGKDNSDET